MTEFVEIQTMELKSASHSSHHRFAWGACYMALSATALALAYLLVKLTIDEINFFLLLFLRFAIPLFVLTSLLISQKAPLKTINLRAHLLRALFVVVAQYSIFYYITKNSLLNATVLLNTAPLFIPFIEWTFLRYHIPKSSWISSLIALIGVMLLLQPGKSLFTTMSFFGLLAGLSIGASQVLFGLNARRESIGVNIFYLYFFGTLFTFIPLPFVYWQTRDLFFSIQNGTFLFWVSLAALGLLNLLNQYFRAKAYTFGKPSTLTTFLFLSVLLSGLFDWFIFKKEPNTLSVIGASLVLLGAVSKIGLRYLFLKRKKLKKHL